VTSLAVNNDSKNATSVAAEIAKKNETQNSTKALSQNQSKPISAKKEEPEPTMTKTQFEA